MRHRTKAAVIALTVVGLGLGAPVLTHADDSPVTYDFGPTGASVEVTPPKVPTIPGPSVVTVPTTDPFGVSFFDDGGDPDTCVVIDFPLGIKYGTMNSFSYCPAPLVPPGG